jgi:hypothetical protein
MLLHYSVVIKAVMNPSMILRAHAMLSERLPFKSVHSLPYVVSQATLVVKELDSELQTQLVPMNDSFLFIVWDVDELLPLCFCLPFSAIAAISEKSVKCCHIV